MSAWFIIGPRGAVYRDHWKRHFCAATRAECIRMICCEHAYYSSIDEVWACFERQGYTCQKRKIT
jgi:hypothetical protein